MSKEINKDKQTAVKKRIVDGVFTALALVLLFVFSYLIYVISVFASYKRLPDNMDLTVDKAAQEKSVKADETYSIISWNIGFGAYTPQFSFFMDGGKYSVAESKDSVLAMTDGASKYAKSLEPDFMLWQEVDTDSDRARHVNQYEYIRDNIGGYDSIFAQNYDSAYIFYPILKPHGKNKSGIVTMSRFPIDSSLRRSLPVNTSVTKILDLDRCYSISRIPVDNGKTLCIINLHNSAYGSSDEVRKGQLEMLCGDLIKEYEAGNYVVCGGDFNHDLKADINDEKSESWAQPFPRQSLPDGFEFCMDKLPENEKMALHNSTRNADEPYNPETTYTVAVDGFIVSDNVEMVKYEHIDLQYIYSDHDPVYMEFILR